LREVTARLEGCNQGDRFDRERDMEELACVAASARSAE
jgi:hypothetical protein